MDNHSYCVCSHELWVEKIWHWISFPVPSKRMLFFSKFSCQFILLSLAIIHFAHPLLTLWATGGGWFSPHGFYRATTVKITLMRQFFYCSTFQVDALRSFWYLFCGHTPLGSRAMVRQSQNTTKKVNFGKIQNGRHWSYGWSEKKV